MSNDVTPPADLLQHAQFVRRLATALLHDESDADDAAQETLVRALRRPPRPGPGLHGWFGAVLRNVIRMDRRSAARRTRRERVHARPEGTRAADETASRAEILQRVAAAVRALPPQDLEVVLLRHYEGLPPRRIAERLRLDSDVVKRRLQRAHGHLRSMLEEGPGGNVEDWRTALAGVFRIPQGPATAAGPTGTAAAAPATVSFHGGGLGAALAAGLVVVGGGLWLLLRSPSGSGDASLSAHATRADAPAADADAGGAPLLGGPAARATGAAVDAPVAAATGLRVSGRVAEPSGQPVPGATVRVRLSRGEVVEETAEVRSAKDGAFGAELRAVLALPPLARASSRVEVEADAPGHRPASRQARFASVTGSGLSGIDLVLEPGGAVRGRVVAVDGRPVRGAKVGWGPSGPAISDGAGRYVLVLEPGLAQRIRVLADGEGIGLSAPLDILAGRDTEAPDITVRGPGSISGVARLADGTPAGDLSVTAWRAAEGDDMGPDFDPQDLAPVGLFRSTSRTAPDGRFRIGGLAPGRYAVTNEFDPLGRSAGRYETGTTDAEVVVNLQRVRLRVQDAEGRPLPGAQYLARWQGNGIDEETDEISRADGTHDLWATDGDTFQVLARVGDAFSTYRRVQVPAGHAQTEVVLTVRPPIPDAGRLEVKATDSEGTPLERFTSTMEPADPSAEGYRADGKDGTASLPLPPGRYRVRVVAEDDLQDPGFLLPAESVVDVEPRAARRVEFRLRLGGRLRLLVTGAPPPQGDVPVHVEVRTARGGVWQPLSIFRSERGDSLPLGRLYLGTWGRNYDVLEVGACQLRLAAPGFRSIEVPAEVRARDVVDVEATLVP